MAGGRSTIRVIGCARLDYQTIRWAIAHQPGSGISMTKIAANDVGM
jgi:hypothetical protein